MEPWWDQEDGWNRPPQAVGPKQERGAPADVAGPNREDASAGPVRRVNGPQRLAASPAPNRGEPATWVLEPMDDTVPAWFSWLVGRTRAPRTPEHHADL